MDEMVCGENEFILNSEAHELKRLYPQYSWLSHIELAKKIVIERFFIISSKDVFMEGTGNQYVKIKLGHDDNL